MTNFQDFNLILSNSKYLFWTVSMRSLWFLVVFFFVIFIVAMLYYYIFAVVNVVRNHFFFLLLFLLSKAELVRIFSAHSHSKRNGEYNSVNELLQLKGNCENWNNKERSATVMRSQGSIENWYWPRKCWNVFVFRTPGSASIILLFVCVWY